MREDPYTGKILDSLDYIPEPTDEDLINLSNWVEDDDIDIDDDEYGTPNETVIRATYAIDGATNLQEAAERLYDYADELLSMATTGWVLVDVITDGQGIAIMLDDKEDDDE